MEKTKNLLLIKGYGDPHPDRWQVHEKEYAESRGLHVAYPEDISDFYNGCTPTVQTFNEFIWNIIERDGLEPDRTIIMAHSMGACGFIRLLEEKKELGNCRTTLISGLKDNLTGLSEIDDFFPTPKLELTQEEIDRILVVGSDNDSVIHEHPSVLAEHLGVEHLVVPGAGHFMPEALHRNPQELDLGKYWMKIRDQIRKLNLAH